MPREIKSFSFTQWNILNYRYCSFQLLIRLHFSLSSQSNWARNRLVRSTNHQRSRSESRTKVLCLFLHPLPCSFCNFHFFLSGFFFSAASLLAVKVGCPTLTPTHILYVLSTLHICWDIFEGESEIIVKSILLIAWVGIPPVLAVVCWVLFYSGIIFYSKNSQEF